jgi:hypothetical protein
MVFFLCMSKLPEVGCYWHLSNICTFFSSLCYSVTECSLTRFRSVFGFQYSHCHAVGACTFNCCFVCCKVINILVYCVYRGISVLSCFSTLCSAREFPLYYVRDWKIHMLYIDNLRRYLFYFVFCQTFEYGICCLWK